MNDLMHDCLDMMQDGFEPELASLAALTLSMRDLVGTHGVAAVLECLRDAADVGANYHEAMFDGEEAGVLPTPYDLRTFAKSLAQPIAIATKLAAQ